MTHRPLLAFVPALCLAACGAEEPTRFVSDSGPRSDAATLDAVVYPEVGAYPDIPAIDVGRVDVPPLLDDVRVYAHTSDALYAVDPRTFSVTRIGDFRWPADGRSHEMTDLAINATGEAWGISFTALYRVDLTTAQCTYLAPFSGSMFNGLSFIPGGELEAGEVLVGADSSGGYYRVNTATGAISRLGAYGGGLGSSGDIVSVASGGTFATIVDRDVAFGEDPVEYLARIDPTNGHAVRLGRTGMTNTWGVGYWRSVVFGFTAGGDVVTLDITTGRATVVAHNNVAWWGAAVTTIAPVAPP